MVSVGNAPAVRSCSFPEAAGIPAVSTAVPRAAQRDNHHRKVRVSTSSGGACGYTFTQHPASRSGQDSQYNGRHHPQSAGEKFQHRPAGIDQAGATCIDKAPPQIPDGGVRHLRRKNRRTIGKRRGTPRRSRTEISAPVPESETGVDQQQ